MDKFLIIDGSSIINRAFYAIKNLSTKTGIQTNAVYGFLKSLESNLKKIEPKYVAVLFDAKGKKFRHELYADYKGGRKKFPEELNLQISFIHEILERRGIKTLSVENYEADDIAGSLVNKFKNQVEIYLLTGDRDYFQLVDKNVKVIFAATKSHNIYDEDAIIEEFGLKPSQLIDLKALIGDKSDNIPGIKGVGEKSVTPLLQEYNDIDGIYDNLDKIKSKSLRTKLEENRDDVLLSYKLGEIYKNLEIDDLDEFVIKESDEESLQEIYRKLELKDYIVDSHHVNIETKFSIISSKEFINELKKCSQNSVFKIIFVGDYRIDEPVAFSLISDDMSYISFEKIEPHLIVDSIKDKSVISFNAKEDIFYLLEEKLEKNPFNDDLALMQYVIDSNLNATDLSYWYEKFFRVNLVNVYDFLSLKENKKKNFEEFDKEVLAHHISIMLKQIKDLYDFENEIIKSESFYDLYKNIEIPLTFTLACMEKNGVKIDIDFLKSLAEDYRSSLKEYEKEIYNLAGEEFNINSPKQLSNILFEKLELPVIKKTKTGYSTDQDVLEKLSEKHELPKLILEYRKDSKLLSTFIEGLLKLVDENGIVRTDFKQLVTTTGRLSSQDPNLQNIPTRHEKGKEIRKSFIARDGYVFYDLDYSQIELRVLAGVSHEEKMIQGFKEDLDIHQKTASEVFDKNYDEVSSLERSHAKAVNFGIVYGISDYGLSQNLNISREKAGEYIDSYLNNFPKIKQYMTDIVKEAKNNGYVETLLHRRRYIPELKNSNFNIRSFGERVALNTPIQGTAADIIKKAMVEINEYLLKNNLKSRLLLTIHDELIIELHKDEMKIKDEIKKIMENTLDVGVYLKVSDAIGENWFDAK